MKPRRRDGSRSRFSNKPGRLSSSKNETGRAEKRELLKLHNRESKLKLRRRRGCFLRKDTRKERSPNTKKLMRIDRIKLSGSKATRESNYKRKEMCYETRERIRYK